MTNNSIKKPEFEKPLSSVEKAVAKLGPRSKTSEFQSGKPVTSVATAATRPGVIVDRSPPPPPSASRARLGVGTRGPSSKSIEIDLDRLSTYGILTPNSEHSLIAEEFRLIKRPILLKALEKGPNAQRNSNLIMIASARSGEGKTFAAISLAMSIASEPDLTVLLVDADVAKSNVPEILGFEADRGLVDVISDDNIELSDVLLRTQLDNFAILPAGRPNHLATEYLASDRMVRLVDDIAERYSDRIVIFDSPPILMSSVPAVLALHVGQMVFVIEADRTPEAVLDSALSLVSSCSNISLLLNKSRANATSDKFGAYYYR